MTCSPLGRFALLGPAEYELSSVTWGAGSLDMAQMGVGGKEGEEGEGRT